MTKLRHIVECLTWHLETERYMVHALCDYSEEASGSGKHTVDQGEVPCEKCLRIAEQRQFFDNKED